MYLVDNVCNAVREDQVRVSNPGVVDVVHPSSDADLEDIPALGGEARAVRQPREVSDETRHDVVRDQPHGGGCLVGSGECRVGGQKHRHSRCLVQCGGQIAAVGNAGERSLSGSQ